HGAPLQIGDAPHLRDRNEAQEPIVPSHEDGQIGFNLGRRLALPLHISDHVVNRGHRDIKLSLNQVRELENRIRSVGEVDFNPAAREVAFALRDPDWPIESAWEDNDRNWLKALLSTNSAQTDSSNNRRRGDNECRRYKALTQFLFLSGYVNWPLLLRSAVKIKFDRHVLPFNTAGLAQSLKERR